MRRLGAPLLLDLCERDLGLHQEARMIDRDVAASGRGQADVAPRSVVEPIGVGEVVAHELADCRADGIDHELSVA